MGSQLHGMPSGEVGFVADIDTPLIPFLTAAERESFELGHDWVGTEHLLLAIMRLADPSLFGVFKRHRVTYAKVRQAVLELLQS